MAITTFDTTLAHNNKASVQSGFLKFVNKYARRFVVIRQEQARHYVNYHLLNMDDKRLEKLGYNRADILRQGSVPTAF